VSDEWSPIDEKEAEDVARMHHGLLYQHVAAAHALVNMVRGRLAATKLVVEKDQDIEIRFRDRCTYLQVKARPALKFSKLSDALIRFHKIRLEHESENRDGGYAFGFLIAGSLGPELAGRDGSFRSALHSKIEELATRHGFDPLALVTTWEMIAWYLPDSAVADLGGITVHASADLALAALVQDLSGIPRLANSAVTTGFALAAAMQALAADSLDGFPERTVEFSRLDSLIHRVRRVAEQLPPLPQDFVLLSLVPHVLGNQVTCFLGTPGSGKTTHLSWLALRETHVLYLRPSAVGPEPLIDQLVGQLRGALESLGVPARNLGPSPAASISAADRIDTLCQAIPSSALVIIDDCHLLDSSADLRILFTTLARRARLALCGQPVRSDGIGTSLGLRRLFEAPPAIVDVQGWSTDDISRYLLKRGRPSDPVTAENLRAVTGGHPLGTADLVEIALVDFGGDLEEAIRAVQTGDIGSTLKAVTAAHFRKLPLSAQRVAAVIAAVEFSPTRDELKQLLPHEEVRSGLEYLSEHRCLAALPRIRKREILELHDAYLAEAKLSLSVVFTAQQRKELHARAAKAVHARLTRTMSARLVPPWFLNHAYGGSLEDVVEHLTGGADLDVVNLQHLGVGVPLSEVLDRLIGIAGSPTQRYWLRDSLIYLNEADDLRIDSDLLWKQQLADFALIKNPTEMLRLAHEHKAMRHAGRSNLAAARAHHQRARMLSSSILQRTFFDYEFSSILMSHQHYEKAFKVLRQSAVTYISQGGVSPLEFWAMKEPALVRHLNSSMSREDVTRLADTLEAAAMCLERMGDFPVEIYKRAQFIYQGLGVAKAELRARILLGRQYVRAPGLRDKGLKILEGTLRAVRKTHTYGAIILCTTALAAAYEFHGEVARGDELLQTLQDYDPREVEEELAAHRRHVGMPLARSLPSARTYLFMFHA
jgi:hypothetical protein